MNKQIENKIIQKILLASKENGGKVNESTVLSITREVLLSEDIITPTGENKAVKEEVMQYSLTDKEMKDELKTLTQLVSSRAKIYNITVTNEDGGNCIMQGELLDFKVKFMFILNESEGCYIKIEKGTKLTNDCLSVLGKVNGYYKNWKESWLQTKLSYYV